MRQARGNHERVRLGCRRTQDVPLWMHSVPPWFALLLLVARVRPTPCLNTSHRR